MTRFVTHVLRRKRLVVLLALAACIVGLAATPVLVQTTSEDFGYPGLAGWEANQEIVKAYGNGGEQRPFVPVVTFPGAVDRESLGRAFDAVAGKPGFRVVSYAGTGDRRFIGDDGRTTFGLIYPGSEKDGSPPGGGVGEVTERAPEITSLMRPHLPEGTRIAVTGLDALSGTADAGGVDVPVKVGLALLAAVIVLWLMFRSVLALVPVLIAAVAVPLSYAVMLALSSVMTIHFVAFQMVPLLGLGIAIDYALILVARWREERAHGHRGDAAVVRAMATAGHAIAFSGCAVAIGLVTMTVLPIPFLRSLGVGGMIVAAASVLAALTLLPVILSTVGARLDRQGKARFAGERRAGRGWSAWARGVVRFRWITLAGVGGLMVALSIIALNINMSVPQSSDLPGAGSARVALDTLGRAGIAPGALTPIDVVVPGGTDAPALAARLAALDGVRTAAAPDSWHSGSSALIVVVPDAESGSESGEATIERVRAAVPPDARVGGYAAQSMDMVTATYDAFPWLVGLVGLVTFVMLARGFRSLLLALKAVVLNLLSLGAVIGVMVLLWQEGLGTRELLGIEPDGTIGQFVPVTIFAFLFGLSMDYEVFVLARMREAYDRSGSTAGAVVEGIGRTGRLVTSAALILFLSFAAMAAGGELDVAVFATGLALGILIDATLVRGLLVPAAVATMGRWNWWLPPWAARLLRVPGSY